MEPNANVVDDPQQVAQREENHYRRQCLDLSLKEVLACVTLHGKQAILCAQFTD